MNKLKPEDVMMGLDCCTRGRKSKNDRPCLECPYNECNIVGGTSERQTQGTCQGWLMKDALDLLRENDEEIARLTNKNDGWKASNKILTTINAGLEAELALTYDLLEESKADTVRKMRERLKYSLCCIAQCHFTYAEVEFHIDRIAKEMLEGTRDE